MSRHPIGVVGAGLGGLAAAITLAARGYRVVVWERADRPGGKAATVAVDGYRFAAGPTIFTWPAALAKVLAEAGRRPEELLDLVRLDPQWRAFFPDGEVLDLVEDEAQMAAALERFAPGSGPGYLGFLAAAGRQRAVAEQTFFWRAVGGLRDTFAAGTGTTLGALRELGLGGTAAELVRAHVTDPRLAQLLDHFLQYQGAAAADAPAVLCCIAHVQIRDGLWYPRGGLAALPEALAALACELDVELRLGEGVTRILRRDGAVAGVETDRGEQIPVAAVVANADAAETYDRLLDGACPDRSGEPSCSAVALLFGLDRRYEHLAHHNFVFSADPAAEAQQVYGRGEPAADPTVYVCAPAVTDPGVAPPGGEALTALVHVPYLRPHHDWHRLLPDYRRLILAKLARQAGLADLEARIRVEQALTPEDFRDRYASPRGGIYGVSSRGGIGAAFKPANRSPVVPGLYLAGGAAHPGAGVPLALMSGWIAADALDQDGLGR